MVLLDVRRSSRVATPFLRSTATVSRFHHLQGAGDAGGLHSFGQVMGPT